MNIINDTFLSDKQYVGRMVKNAFGMDEVVSLKNSHWRHFDWLEANGKDMDEWLKALDVERHSHKGFNISLETYLEMALVQDEARRHRAGEDVPLFINPEGYPAPEKKTGENQEIKREVVNASGETVPVTLPSRYWQYFDWLERKGEEMKDFTQQADRSREQKERSRYTLRGILMLLLAEDEKKRFYSDEPSAMFIKPEGYD
jgi:hypothetical protein